MGIKLAKGTYPDGHGPNDFQCFGPPATQDAKFEGTKICDCGCFTQDGKDSNKYYHAAIVKSRKDGNFYVYFEWGRTGVGSASCQFVQCSSERDAEEEYCDQLHSKNDKRGCWATLAGKKVLQAKPGKDCYLVRPQATRSTGLPDARTIATNEVTKITTTNGGKKNGNGKHKDIDPQTLNLMRDLNVATVNYAKTSMADSAIPTQQAIDEARDILQEAKKRLIRVGDKTDDQVNDATLKSLTYTLYGRIPKHKARNAAASEWILSANNIGGWECDLDAFESALAITNMEIVTDEDPLGGMPLTMSWLNPNSEIGKFFYNWTSNATRRVHGNINEMHIRNVWVVDRNGEAEILARAQAEVMKTRFTPSERPLHQPQGRPDAKDVVTYTRSHTCLMLHGTRSVNVSGILRTSFRLPKELVGVKLNSSMFGGGIYWADDIGKCAQYTSLGRAMYTRDNPGAVRGREAFLFIGDVVLGNPYVASHGKGFTNPPAGYHSVCGKMNHTYFYEQPHWETRKLMNNEFIVYSAAMCRIRYLVEFQA